MSLSMLPFDGAEAARKSNEHTLSMRSRSRRADCGRGGLLVLRGVLWGTRYGWAGCVDCGCDVRGTVVLVRLYGTCAGSGGV